MLRGGTVQAVHPVADGGHRVYNALASDITTGPDSNLWFTASGDYWVGRVTTEGVVLSFTKGVPASRPVRRVGETRS
ncbi:MAG: hypothetical protein M0Z30_01225 [Actinomycetota bacterium]|nr:hypothetical protein [Actinomycetota bacterium]